MQVQEDCLSAKTVATVQVKKPLLAPGSTKEDRYCTLDTLSTQLPWTQLILFLIEDLVRLIFVVCLKLFA